MHYVIIRDDDTNALTPVECLERLYRPFLARGLPVNLATIPEVATNATQKDGRPEGFLVPFAHQSRNQSSPPTPKTCAAATIALAANPTLVAYLRDNPGFHILQHGCHHDYLEFDCDTPAEVARRLEQGTQRLLEAGFPQPQTFVAPYDKLSRAGLLAVAQRFRVLSSGWYELRRLPFSWWPRYALKKLRHSPHWQVGSTLLLSHPGCLLSCHHTLSTMMGGIFHYLQHQRLTVLVTHWWEYFRNGCPDEPFIEFLHETAGYLATHPDLKVISFADLAEGNYPLN
jgi:Uncharacterized protein conserved in bacteria (DUF2334)